MYAYIVSILLYLLDIAFAISPCWLISTCCIKLHWRCIYIYISFIHYPYVWIRLLFTITNNAIMNILVFFVSLGIYMSFSGAAVFKVGSTDSLDGPQHPFRVSQDQTVFIVPRLDLPFFTLILSWVFNGIIYIFKKIIIFSKTK